MNELSEKEIDLISKDIDRQGLTYIQLKNEILDHICCQIEVKMDQGLMFNHAYRKVMEEMGKKRIREIQHETLNLISKKYRRMKRIMFALGVAAPILILAGAAFKVNHWPGAGIILTLALLMIGLFFLPIFVMVRIRDTRQQNQPVPLGLYLSGLIPGIITMLGTLFKVQHWPGASVMLTLGLTGMAFLFLPMYASYRIREAGEKNEQINKKLWIGGTVAGILFILGALFKIMHWPGAGIVILTSWSLVGVVFLPLLVLNQLKQSENKINTFFNILVVSTSIAIFFVALIGRMPQYQKDVFELSDNNYIENSLYFQSASDELVSSSRAENSDNMEKLVGIQTKADHLVDYIQTLKISLIEYASEENAVVMDQQGRIDLSQLQFYFVSEHPYDLIVNEEGNRLYSMLSEFRAYIVKVTGDDKLEHFIQEQLKLESSRGEGADEWARYCFTGPYLHSVNMLSMYESVIRMLEYELMRELNG
jgi:hypothetical protein